MTFGNFAPLWPEHESLSPALNEDGDFEVNSDRSGGDYVIPPLVAASAQDFNERERAQITTWLVDQRINRVLVPRLTNSSVGSAIARGPLPVEERAERLLRFMARMAEHVGDRVTVERGRLAAYAWTESIEWDEVAYLLNYLVRMAWISGGRFVGGGFQGIVTVEGYDQIAYIRSSPSSVQAFVAMWFNDNLAQAYEEGFAAGIREAGYDPLRIDQKEHVNRIEDEIIAEIRRSRFVVADFTHGDDGSRGGVYYEAGFAHGLGLPVVFTCHKDSLETLHFDTSHFSHIVWSEPEDLREQLRNRIRAVIGQGPGFTGEV